MRFRSLRQLFDDARRPKIEAFIKNLQKLVDLSLPRARTGEINLFLAAMRAILWELHEPFRNCETRINKKRPRIYLSHIDELIAAFGLH